MLFLKRGAVCEYRALLLFFFKTICVLEYYVYLCGMENVLTLYTYIDGVNDTPFPNVENQVVISSFRYESKRMGVAPSLSCTIMHKLCLDKLWSDNVYAVFNGEKYFIKQIPSSSYSNNDSRYKHEVTFVSERSILDGVYVYDVVDADYENDKPVSNSSKFSFYGTINEFAERLNQSLAYSNVGYTIVVDDGITSEGKLLSFDDKYFSEALQEIYNTFDIPYYFVGKVIHIGYTNNAITHTFKYGADESLLSIQKTNANFKTTNRVTGIGSQDNIPYYYPNRSEKGETNALYNGSTDNVQIVDSKKYDKLYLSDKLTYSHIAPKTTIPFEKKDYRSLDYKLLSFNQKQIILTYFITIYEDQVLNFWQHLRGQETWNKADIYGVDNDFHESIYGKYTKTLKTGQYKIVIDDIATIYIEDTSDDKWVETVIDDYFSIEVSLTTLEKYGWSLNGEMVDLKDYGLSVLSTPKVGDVITFERTNYIAPQQYLMPPIYRESFGKERFYNALNNEYPNGDGGYYEFENPYIEGKPKEQIVSFEHIKPSIVGATNANGQRIDMFIDFAYDENDNDETKIVDGEEVYAHPYFFAKLRKFDGQFGFNLFDYAIDEGEMTISMTSGSCGACNFIVQVNEENKNTVQVDSNGNLKRGDNGDVLFGEPQDRQNDTIHNEVWVALKKDTDTFGVIMPNASNKYKPSTNDTFVILHIDLPYAYIEQAENKLKDEIIKYMSLNNSEKFTFSITFSRIFFAENPSILSQLNENARIQIEYDGNIYELYISSYSYVVDSNSPLPEIKVELSDTLTITQNALQQAISNVKEDILSNSSSVDVLKTGLRYFLRKDVDDRSKGAIASDKRIEVGRFKEGTFGSGAAIYQDENGNTYGEVDFFKVRKKATFTDVVIQEARHIGGEEILSAASMFCESVEELTGGYKCYMRAKDPYGKVIINQFVVGDQAFCNTFNLDVNRYYWRLVTEVGYNYIVLSKDDCDKNSDIPQVDDKIILLGNRNDETRQSAIILSAYGSDAPSYKQYDGINDYSLVDKEVTKLSPKGNRLTGVLSLEKGSTGWRNLEGLPDSIQEALTMSEEAKKFVESQEYGKNNLLRNSGFTGDYVTASLQEGDVLTGGSDMFSPSLVHWISDGATPMESDVSESGKEVMLISGGSLRQRIVNKVMVGESYVFSFRGRGIGSVTFSFGGYTKNIAFNSEDWELYVEKFVATQDESRFSIEAYEDCFLCELQLERGTLRSAWGISPLDNRSELAKYESLRYMSDAIEKGSTDFFGGLILTNMMLMRNLENKVTSGSSGVYSDDNSVAYFAGGDMEAAVRTAMAYMDDPTYQPTQEELNNMAKYVVTHGGRAILNDVILRGYIYALGGKFKGEIEATSGIFKNVTSPNGRFSIDENGFVRVSGGRIGGFSVNGNRLSNQDEKGNYLTDAVVSSRNFNSANETDRMAEIGADVLSGVNGVSCVGRFENNDQNRQAGTNYGIMVGAYNAKNNAAISMEGGYIQGFALKTTILNSYATSYSINKKDANILCWNNNNLTIYLPSMSSFDDGHFIRIKRLGSSITLRTMDCETIKSDGSIRTSKPVFISGDTSVSVIDTNGLSLGGQLGAVLELVWVRDIEHNVNGTTYYGAWVVINKL